MVEETLHHFEPDFGATSIIGGDWASTTPGCSIAMVAMAAQEDLNMVLHLIVFPSFQYCFGWHGARNGCVPAAG